MAKKTVFQQLSDLFGPEKSTRESKSRYSLNDKELLKTQSKEEYDYQKLQMQRATVQKGVDLSTRKIKIWLMIEMIKKVVKMKVLVA